MRDWLDVVATGRDRPRGSNVDYEAGCRFARFDLLEVGIVDDPVAPPEACDELEPRASIART